MQPEPPKDDDIRKALEEGRVDTTPRVDIALASLNLLNPDRTLTNTSLHFWGPYERNQGGMGIDWMTESAGCGRCDFYLIDDTLRCYNQGMNKEFLLTLLNHVLGDTAKEETDPSQDDTADLQSVTMSFEKIDDVARMKISWQSSEQESQSTGNVEFKVIDKKLVCSDTSITKGFLSNLLATVVQSTQLDQEAS